MTRLEEIKELLAKIDGSRHSKLLGGLAWAVGEIERSREDTAAYRKCANYWWAAYYAAKGEKPPTPRSSDKAADQALAEMVDRRDIVDRLEAENKALRKKCEDYWWVAHYAANARKSGKENRSMSGSLESLVRHTRASSGDAANDHDAIARVRPVDVFAVKKEIEQLRAIGDNVLVFSSGHYFRVFGARWLGLEPAAGRYLLLSTATLSIVGYEHNLNEPVLRLWNDDRHVGD